MQAEPTRLLVLRHGQTDWNASGRIQGQLDIGLNDTGRRQAERLAEALAHESIDAVYSSDLLLARETAAPLARARGLEPKLDAGLRERGFGAFEGLDFAEIVRRYPEDAARWRRREPDFGPGGGERLADFYERSVTTALRIAATNPGGSIALVAHGGVLDCLYRAAIRLALDAPRTWQLANAGINRLLHTGEGFMLVGWNDVSHLE